MGEIGIDLDKAGATSIHVLHGHADVRPTGGVNSPANATLLKENDLARIRQGDESPDVAVTHCASASKAFARRVFRPVYPHVSDSEQPELAAWLKSIGATPPGRIRAVGSGADIVPMPAVKDRPASPSGPPRDESGNAGGVTYTYRKTFVVNDMAPSTAALYGRFVTQGYASAIRINGTSFRGSIPTIARASTPETLSSLPAHCAS